MFSNPLPDDELYRVYISKYAERHFIKRFAKDHKGKIWLITLESIKDDLRRVRALTNKQQVDELLHKDTFWLFKYDFAVAQSNISPKKSGNRCVVVLDSSQHRIDVLLVYAKSDLPKNVGETQYIRSFMQSEYPQYWQRFQNM